MFHESLPTKYVEFSGQALFPRNCKARVVKLGISIHLVAES